MITNDEFQQLQQKIIKYFSSKKNKYDYKDILNDIEELDKSSYLYSKKEMSFSSMMYQVKYLKGVYGEKIKNTIQTYQSIIFPDFSYKNDLNTLISGPYSLKLWLIRYMCLQKINFELDKLINDEIKSLTITKQYQEIDIILFKNVLDVTILSN